MTVLALVHTGLVLLAESDSDSDFGAIGLLFLLSGFVFYGYVFLRYRNADKRHHYESETEATKLNLTRTDDKIKSMTGLTNAKMSGANNTAVDGAGGFPMSLNQLKGLTGQLNPLMQKIQQQATKASAASANPDSGGTPTQPPPAAPSAAPPPPNPPSSPPPPGSGQSF